MKLPPRFYKELKDKWGDRIWRIIDALPAALPAALATFSTVAVLLLLLGEFKNIYIWPLGALTALVTFLLVARNFSLKAPGSEREKKLIGLAALIFISLWTIFNIFYAAQDIIVYRDPGIYATTGEWLKSHDNLSDISVQKLFGNNPHLGVTAAGFGYDIVHPGHLFAQGMHLLPALLGLAGRIGGDGLLLRLNPVIGGVALLAVYGFARCFMRPRWAFLAVTVMAVSLPAIYFSRDTYTEPLAMLFTFGALSLLWIANQTLKYPLWFLAGLTAGAGALTRPDGYLTVAAFAAFGVIYVAMAPLTERRRRLTATGLILAGMAITSLLAWLDITHLAHGYYMTSTGEQIRNQAKGIYAILLLGIITIPVVWRTRILAVADRLTKKWRAPAILILLLAVLVLLVSRPLWYAGHTTAPNRLVAALQRASGSPVDPYRSYVEYTPIWVAWYVGPVMAAAGAIGMAAVAALSAKKRDLLYLPGALTIIGTSLVFFTKIGISPDQVWASRRLLPVVLPGFVVFGTFGLQYTYDKYLNRYNLHYLFMATLCSLSILLPLYITYPFLRTRSYTPQLMQIHNVCHALKPGDAVIWVGSTANNAVMTIRSFCGVPARALAKPGPGDIEEVSSSVRRAHYRPLLVTTSKDEVMLPADYELSVVSSIHFVTVPATLYHPPRRTTPSAREVLMGRVDDKGAVSALTGYPIYMKGVRSTSP